MTAKKEAVKGDVAEQVAEDEDKGYHGDKVDPRPNSDYTLESGPDSPPAVDDPHTGVSQPSAVKES